MRKFVLGVFLIVTANQCVADDTLSWRQIFTRNNSTRNIYKRSLNIDEDRPCTCESRIEWTDLGEHIYPRHLRETKCTSTHCWFGHNRCIPLYYTVRVLAKNTSPYEDPLLPEALRSDWAFTEKIVSVGCLCSR